MKSFALNTLSAAVLSAVAFAGTAHADGHGSKEASEFSVSANVALSSDYWWRGASQTDNQPSLSGGFDLGHDSGFYAGVWAANVDGGSENNIEIDLYVGISGETDSGIGWDVGFLHYDFPGNDGADADEIYFGVSYSYFGAYLYHDSENDNNYWDLTADFDIAEGVALGLHYGINDPDVGSTEEDWKIGVSTSMADLDWEIAYVDSSVDTNTTDGRVLLTVSKSF